MLKGHFGKMTPNNPDKHRKATALVFLVLVCLFSQGCVGVVLRQSRSEAFEPVKIARERQIDGANLGKDKESAEWLMEHWGKPTRVERISQPVIGEKWTYDFKRRWCGVLPCIIIPIPLVLPVAKDTVVFDIRGGSVERAEVKALWAYEWIAGFGPEGFVTRNEWVREH